MAGRPAAVAQILRDELLIIGLTLGLPVGIADLRNNPDVDEKDHYYPIADVQTDAKRSMTMAGSTPSHF